MDNYEKFGFDDYTPGRYERSIFDEYTPNYLNNPNDKTVLMKYLRDLYDDVVPQKVYDAIFNWFLNDNKKALADFLTKNCKNIKLSLIAFPLYLHTGKILVEGRFLAVVCQQYRGEVQPGLAHEVACKLRINDHLAIF